MRVTLLILAALAALLVPGPLSAVASHPETNDCRYHFCYCPHWDTGVGTDEQRIDATTRGPVPGSVMVTAGTGGSTWYIVEDWFYVQAFWTNSWFSLWIYEESNGIAGLQRGDEVCDQTGGGLIEADTIVS